MQSELDALLAAMEAKASEGKNYVMKVDDVKLLTRAVRAFTNLQADPSSGFKIVRTDSGLKITLE